MRLLLDTHVFRWFISGDRRLPDSFRKEICAPENDVLLSVVSIWEAMVKHAIGKLSLPTDPAIYLSTQRERHSISSLSLDEASVMQLSKLPGHHRDPFDRMLFCQALCHSLTLVSQAKMLSQYKVPMLD